jgi:hypothetical protein
MRSNPAEKKDGSFWNEEKHFWHTRKNLFQTFFVCFQLTFCSSSRSLVTSSSSDEELLLGHFRLLGPIWWNSCGPKLNLSKITQIK